MSETFELGSFPQQTIVHTPLETKSRSNANFWLIIVVIILIAILIILIIVVLAPINTAKNDVNEVTIATRVLSPTIEKVISSEELALASVDNFIKNTQTTFNNITSEGESALEKAENLVVTAQRDLQDTITNFCNVRSDITFLPFDMRFVFPTLCSASTLP